MEKSIEYQKHKEETARPKVYMAIQQEIAQETTRQQSIAYNTACFSIAAVF
jgi:hypothetical protein